MNGITAVSAEETLLQLALFDVVVLATSDDRMIGKWGVRSLCAYCMAKRNSMVANNNFSTLYIFILFFFQLHTTRLTYLHLLLTIISFAERVPRQAPIKMQQSSCSTLIPSHFFLLYGIYLFLFFFAFFFFLMTTHLFDDYHYNYEIRFFFY